MKSPRCAKPGWAAVLVLCGSCFVGSVSAQTDAEFACQVVAEGGKPGLVVVVQASSRAVAERLAVGAKAYTADRILSPATKVVQCIVMGEESFKDQQFQQFYQTVPR